MSSDNLRYRWFKLSAEFMESDEVDMILDQEDGDSYLVIFLQLVIKSINSDGKLSMEISGDIIPFDIKKLTRDLKHWSIDTVRMAINLLIKLEFLYIDENNVLSISNFTNLVGSETQSARKKRKQRNNLKELEEKTASLLIEMEKSEDIQGDNVPPLSRQCPTREEREDIRLKSKILKNDIDNNDDENEKSSQFTATKKLLETKVITPELIKSMDQIFNKSDLSDYAITLIVDEILKFSQGKIYDPVAYFTRAFGKQEFLFKCHNDLKSKNNKIDIDYEELNKIIEIAKKEWFAE